MVKPGRRGEIRIRRNPDGKECDVIVAIGDHEMVVHLPDYGRAVQWAEMEAKAYKITARPWETNPGMRLASGRNVPEVRRISGNHD